MLQFLGLLLVIRIWQFKHGITLCQWRKANICNGMYVPPFLFLCSVLFISLFRRISFTFGKVKASLCVDLYFSVLDLDRHFQFPYHNIYIYFLYLYVSFRIPRKEISQNITFYNILMSSLIFAWRIEILNMCSWNWHY